MEFDDDFSDDHYTRDWDFLAEIAREWALIRAQFGFGSRVPLQRIEEDWDVIFNADKRAWPAIRRVHSELMGDHRLKRHLRKCFYRELADEERRGYQFEGESRNRNKKSVDARVLTRIFWQVVRNADSYLQFRGELDHWARFWTTKNLTTELRRTIEYFEEREQPDEGIGGPVGPNPAEDPAALSELKEKMVRYCETQEEKAVIEDWFDNAREDADREQGVCDRHEVTLDAMNALLRRVAQRIRDEKE